MIILTPGESLQMVQEAIITVIYASAPPLLLGLVVGVIVSIFQAVTSIQEPTLAFVPKILAVFLAIYVFGSWMWTILMQFALNLFDRLPSIINGVIIFSNSFINSSL